MGKCKKMQRTDKWSSQKNIVPGQYSLVSHKLNRLSIVRME